MKIKKEIKLIIIILVVLLLILFIRKLFLKKYNILYEKNDYVINEIYKYKNKNHNYEINIKNKKYEITYNLIEDFNKNKEIINNIKVYKEDNITCLLPIYNKEIENKLYCLEDNNQVSNYYLKDNLNYKKILKKTKKYNIKNISISDKKTNYKKLEVYENNIASDDIFTIWNYKGINIIKKDENKTIKILDYDLYDNIKSIIFDKYYVLFENNHVDGIKNIYYYDLEKDKLEVYNPEIIISKDMYINGVINDLIYVTDNKSKNEYSIDLKREEIVQVNKPNEYIVYENNDEIRLTKSDYFLDTQLFNNKKVIDKNISEEEHIKENNIYYFIEDNNFYRQLNKRNKELLFELENIKEWKIINNKILLISDDILYLYEDSRGLVPIIKSNELNYNYENICDYKEKN